MKSLLLTAALTLATSAGFAATHTIKMLNNGKEESKKNKTPFS